MIDFKARGKIFHLKGRGSSYVIGVTREGDVHQLHWGASLSEADIESLLNRWREGRDNPLLEFQNREFANFGNNDLRSPAFLVQHSDGSRLSQFRYQGHEILPGKPDFEGPQSYVQGAKEASTLRLMLSDGVTGQLLDLYITIYPERDIFTRRAVITQGPQAGALLRMMSASLDFPAGDWWAVSLAGDWARERMIQKGPLRQGMLRLENRRGSQSHRLSPFIALSQGAPEEQTGQVWALTMIYSGNWLIEAERHASGRLRVNAGLNDFDFRWQMETTERFVTPECVLAYSDEGLGGLSRKIHRFVKKRICRGPWRDAVRPVLINSWEGHYFKFKHQDIIGLAESAKELGMDLIVLDDGWFGKRNDDTTSLGDWYDDTTKLPDGIKGLADAVHAMGLRFGLWFEPEAISPKSELYREHPDWAFAVPGRSVSTSRNQYVLDMSRPEVRDYLFSRLSHYIEAAGLDYIKWDMNRPLWELGSTAWPIQRQAELAHRFMMGTYELMGKLRDHFPQVLVEGCTGGGGRFDLGMLCYHPQFWTSDNTDAIDRIFMQYGSSLFLPPITMSAHVSAVPNHQNHRITPLALRGHVAMGANFGLELDPAKLNSKEKKEVIAQVRAYKEIRHLVQDGDFYRLADPFSDPRPAWSFVSENKREVVVFAFQPSVPFRGYDPLPLRLQGLNPEDTYEVLELKQSYSGNYLMRNGVIPVFGPGDFQSNMLRLRVR